MEPGILDNVAPCGLVCYTCNGCNHGVIKELSTKLLHFLGGYDDFVFKSWPDDSRIVKNSLQVLEQWASLDCPGCRREDHQCHNRGCVVRACSREKGHAFCAQCNEFPCDKNNESEESINYWRDANARIREVGAEAYFDENRGKSHYSRFKALN